MEIQAVTETLLLLRIEVLTRSKFLLCDSSGHREGRREVVSKDLCAQNGLLDLGNRLTGKFVAVLTVNALSTCDQQVAVTSERQGAGKLRYKSPERHPDQ